MDQPDYTQPHESVEDSLDPERLCPDELHPDPQVNLRRLAEYVVRGWTRVQENIEKVTDDSFMEFAEATDLSSKILGDKRVAEIEREERGE